MMQSQCGYTAETCFNSRPHADIFEVELALCPPGHSSYFGWISRETFCFTYSSNFRAVFGNFRVSHTHYVVEYFM